MYSSYPAIAEVIPIINGSQVEMSLNMAKHVTPDRIGKLLRTFGWETTVNDPNTGEMLWQKADASIGTNDHDPNLSNGYWRWYEAVAYEFARFVNIGLES